MALERKLAEIEILAEDLGSSLSDNLDFPMCVETYLYNIREEASIFEEAYQEAKKSLKDNDLSAANKHIGDFSLSSKNLADNLNRLMQSLYGEFNGQFVKEFESLAGRIDDPRRVVAYLMWMGVDPVSDLKNLKKTEGNTPETKDGKSLYELFTETHNHRDSNPLVRARNRKGHGNGSFIVSPDSTVPSGFGVNPKDLTLNYMDAQDFLNEYGEKYLGLAKVILETISRDREGGESNKGIRVGKRRIDKFLHRNQDSIKTNIYRAGLIAIAGMSLLRSCYSPKESKDVVIPISSGVIEEKFDETREFADAYKGLYGKEVKYKIIFEE